MPEIETSQLFYMKAMRPSKPASWRTKPNRVKEQRSAIWSVTGTVSALVELGKLRPGFEVSIGQRIHEIVFEEMLGWDALAGFAPVGAIA